jgi:hypothetical protein
MKDASRFAAILGLIVSAPLTTRAQSVGGEPQGSTSPESAATGSEEPVTSGPADADAAVSLEAAPAAQSRAAIAPTSAGIAPGSVHIALDNGAGQGSTPGLGTPPTFSTTGGIPWTVALGTQTFGQYELLFPAGADWNHRFAVPRVWVYLGFRVENAVGRVLLEGTRAIDDGSLSGIADDSLLLRLREAWGGYRVADLIELRAGLIPTLLTPSLTQHWGLRGVARIGLREHDLLAPADLGASAFIDLPEGFGRAGVSYTNGEGYSSRELNRGKNLEVAVDVHPLAFVPELRPLTVVLGYTNGSLGAGSARSDRVVGSLLWDQAEIGGGVSAAYVLGIGDRGEREGGLLDVWLRGLLFDHLILGAQFLHYVRDMGTGSDALTSVTLTAGALVIDQFRVYLAVDGRFADPLARVTAPAWERWDVRLVVEVDLVARVFGAI